MKETLFVSFSGGRTSAYMCWWLINNKSADYEFIFVFANTGQEHENTLLFVDQCDKKFELNLTWVEAVVHHGERKGSTHKVVTYETAARNGEPFEEVIKKYGIPSPTTPFTCTRELKINTMASFRRSRGFKSNHLCALGIRVDEMDRMHPDESKGMIYPLISMNPTTKAQVRHWWADQDFDLNVDEHYGNCVTCWKKSDRKLMTIAKYEPERFEFFKRMESEHSFTGPSGMEHHFFRNRKTVSDIIASSNQPFKEFVDVMPELQLTMGFDIEDLDKEMDCGAGCEIT